MESPQHTCCAHINAHTLWLTVRYSLYRTTSVFLPYILCTLCSNFCVAMMNHVYVGLNSIIINNTDLYSLLLFIVIRNNVAKLRSNILCISFPLSSCPLYLLLPVITRGCCCFVGSDSLVTPVHCLQLPEDYKTSVAPWKNPYLLMCSGISLCAWEHVCTFKEPGSNFKYQRQNKIWSCPFKYSSICVWEREEKSEKDKWAAWKIFKILFPYVI